MTFARPLQDTIPIHAQAVVRVLLAVVSPLVNNLHQSVERSTPAKSVTRKLRSGPMQRYQNGGASVRRTCQDRHGVYLRDARSFLDHRPTKTAATLMPH